MCFVCVHWVAFSFSIRLFFLLRIVFWGTKPCVRNACRTDLTHRFWLEFFFYTFFVLSSIFALKINLWMKYGSQYHQCNSVFMVEWWESDSNAWVDIVYKDISLVKRATHTTHRDREKPYGTHGNNLKLGAKNAFGGKWKTGWTDIWTNSIYAHTLTRPSATKGQWSPAL